MRLARAADVFVGRESELAALTKWSAALGAPRAGVAVVVGEAGLGKSTLLGRAFGDWEGAGGLLLAGGGVAIPGLEGLQSPFGVFTEALRGVASRSDVDARVRGLVSRWLDSSRRTGELDPTQRRREELLEVVQELSSTRRLLLALEDLHWADPSSLGALVFLARQLTSEPVGIVVASRRPLGSGPPPPFASVLEHLQRLPDALVVELAGLSGEETAELARAHGATDPSHVDTIVSLAEGNPLATVEMASAGTHGGETPASVRAAVQAQWDALSAAGRRMLGAAAVIGSQIPHALLSRVSHTNEAPTLQEGSGAVQEVLATGLLQSTESGYRFRHALDRRAVYELLLPEERIRLHERVAQEMTAQLPTSGRRDAQSAAEIAAHWSLTDNIERVASACIEAGMSAYDAGAYPEALSHLDRGLRSWARAGGSSQLCPPIGDIVRAVFDASHSTHQRARSTELLELLEPHFSEDDLSRLLSKHGALLCSIGDREAGHLLYERAAASAVSSRVRAEVLVWYAGSLSTGPRAMEALELVNEALPELDGEEAFEHVLALATLSALMAMEGDKKSAWRAITDARRMANRMGDQSVVWGTLAQALLVLDMIDEPLACLETAREVIDRAHRHRLIRSQEALLSLANAAETLVDAGEWNGALSLVDEICGDLPPGSEVEGALHMQKAAIQLRRGDGESARASLNRAKPLTGGQWIVSWADLHRLEAEERLWAGDLQAALNATEDGIRRLGLSDPGTDISVLPFVAAGLRVTADAAASPSHKEQALGLATQLDGAVAELADRSKSRISLWMQAHVLLALAESARGRGVDEPAQWRRAVEAWRARLNPYDVAYCQFREAESRIRHGDRRGAQAPLREALATASQLRAAPLSDALTALARRARIPVSAEAESEQQAAAVPPRAASAGLTQRECEVLRLLLDGLTNRQIARSLTISERTVGVHVSNVLGKLGVHSRAQAAALTHRSRLLADD